MTGKRYDIGFSRALELTLNALGPLLAIDVAVEKCAGLATARNVEALLASPSVTSSMKDGLAVVSSDLEDASSERPVGLRILGMVWAGEQSDITVRPGCAVKVTTGAPVPFGADAVLAIEFARCDGDQALCTAPAEPGRNVLPAGRDVTAGEVLVGAGQPIAPAMSGLLAASGHATVRVHPRPRIGLVATGDEVVAPGRSLGPGQLYASNLVTLAAWLEHFRMESRWKVVSDDPAAIRAAFEEMLDGNDALITSGGAWKSERDQTVRILEDMGWNKVFHRVRLGPGKAVAFGTIRGKAVFCLPGGPPSNEMAFLQIALPGLLKMAGLPHEPFRLRKATMEGRFKGENTWTQVFQAGLEQRNGELFARPLRQLGRLHSQAAATALVTLPEGTSLVEKGRTWDVQVLFDR